jgi:hypothetical protein
VEVGKEEGAANVRLAGGELGDHGSHGRDLTLEPVDQVGAVASVDQQQFLAWGEDAAALVDPQPSAGAFCFDHGDVTGADCDVVDVVRPRLGIRRSCSSTTSRPSRCLASWRAIRIFASAFCFHARCFADLRSAAREPGGMGRGARRRAGRAGRTVRTVRAGAHTRGPCSRQPTRRPLRTFVLAVSSFRG